MGRAGRPVQLRAVGTLHTRTCHPLQGQLFKQYLSGEKLYSCSECKSHVADHQNLISKAFQGRHGRAYLFSDVCVAGNGAEEWGVCDVVCDRVR